MDAIQLNISPVQLERFINNPISCADDITATLANHYGRNYIHMFAQSWSFHFEEINTRKYFENIKLNKMQNNILYDCSGMKFKFHKFSEKNFKSVLTNQLNQNKPIVIHFDSFYCPWDIKLYNNSFNYHNNHLCIITGIDAEMIAVCDPWHNVMKKININDINEGCKHYYTLTLDDVPSDIKIDYEYLVDNLRKSLQLDKKSSCFDSIRRFGESFYKNFAYSDSDNDDFLFSSFGNILLDVAYFRCRWYLFVDYIYKQGDLTNFLDGINYQAYKQIIISWMNVRLLISKAFIQKNNYNLHARIADKIKAISDEEKEFANRIIC